MNFKGTARKLQPQDWTIAANAAGTTEVHMRAIAEVEARGSGFDSDGKPVILFEPHKFYAKVFGEKRQRAVDAGIAYKKQGSKPYPRTSRLNYDRLELAIAIDETAALESTSWGLGQIMGENYELAGYNSVQEMVEAFMESEGNQLSGMANFIKNTYLSRHLEKNDWAAFAKGYNGPAYKKNKYDEKLATAYAKWKKRLPQIINQGEKDDEVLSLGDKGTKVRALQTRLKELEYIVKPDGDFGNMTRDAVLAFQADNNLPTTGTVDSKTWAALDTAEKRPLPESRTNATVADLREEGSRIVANADALKAVAGGAAVLGGGTAASDKIPTDPGTVLGTVSEWVAPLTTIKNFASDNWGIILIAFCVIVWFLSKRIQNARVEDKQTGKSV